MSKIDTLFFSGLEAFRNVFNWTLLGLVELFIYLSQVVQAQIWDIPLFPHPKLAYSCGHFGYNLGIAQTKSNFECQKVFRDGPVQHPVFFGWGLIVKKEKWQVQGHIMQSWDLDLGLPTGILDHLNQQVYATGGRKWLWDILEYTDDGDNPLV